MSDTVIRVENLGKKYIIGHQQQERYTALRDVIANKVKSLSSLINPKARVANPAFEEFWALKDVSFEIKQGDRVGIIGRNGAGKSTLLKILSRITEPTTGSIKIKGRVASLLEVGTGFHPELTGRENIFLNGAILGMGKDEIKQKFDEIVAFAEVEKFLDTPVKRYSSGMYVRLAFAVAAHLEPEILIVDEVLAVGDAQFQKKCLGKMEDVAEKEGRTVLFVSHNMTAVTRLCNRALWLDTGKLKIDGDIYEVSGKYLQSDLGTSAERHWTNPKNAPGDSVARLKAVRVISEGVVTETVDIRYPVILEMEYWNLKSDAQLLCGFSFFNDQGVMLFVSADFQDPEWGNKSKPIGIYKSHCVVPGNLLAEGQVKVVAEVSTRHPVYEIHVLEYDSVCFQVVDTGEAGSVRAEWGRNIPGVVRPQLEWKTEFLQEAI
ncbi:MULTISPECIES: ABC transporter ATP-binding protein [unclassified Nodularia (in: cyanobacteria)]|uniref:ABC transporter ATP-binding protein n=1 Tax=unclassified Nodularia (in: cyanobacteria) TaxID=2656917 RepID=UPI00187F91BA|nr:MULTISPECIES: ABC transporter ATP-binding protein [unclassified Nodularia (in: cyanobacteria)]MBE9199400.1 ABC transporter ATP-binding protein [Nodularia sp. LEGE 06071]MCC2692898.1 ABC transporter ATP-binding protein [Nodularia sp. LEGE 04288]